MSMKSVLWFLLVAVAFSATAMNVNSDGILQAAGPWEMEQASNPGVWMPAKVPGTVLATLVENGIVPEPYQGLNNKYDLKLIPDLRENRDFYTVTYRTKVAFPKEWDGRKIFVRPEGINYRSEIRLNGHTAGVTAGMFQRTVVDVTHLAKVGETNDLVVKVSPLDFPGGPGSKPWGAPGEWRNGGDGFIGKNVTMLMSAGWDFMFNDGIRDRNTGIWRPITFFSSGDVRLDHPFVRTKLNADMSEAELEMEVEVCNAAKYPHYNVEGDITAVVEGTDIKVTKEFELGTGERRFIKLRGILKNPKLWWPVNKGERHFYNVNFLVNAAGYDAWWQHNKAGHVPPRKQAVVCKARFAVRECRSDQSGPDGARQFYVNRRKVFIRGTNWIPEAMQRTDDKRMEREIRLTAESGVNMLRLWAGGIVESDRFYELCDEYGILVWQEFFLTADTCQPDDRALYLDNVAQQVKRIRNHPCVVHWCGANESTSIEGTEKLIRELTGTESWTDQSEGEGIHDGSPYFTVNPMRYYHDTASTRGRRVYGFSPEYGTCAMPCYEQILSFMPEKLLWPMEGNEKNWNYREGGGFNQLTKYHHLAVQAYGESSSLEEYARKSQAVDALGHRALWETWNFARNHATGILFWYNNTPVPQLGSHAWDYDLNQEAVFFAQRNALEPLHAQYEYVSNRVAVVSDIVADRYLSVKAEVYDFNTKKIWEREQPIDVLAERCVTAFSIPFEKLAKENPLLAKPHFIKLRLFDGERQIASTFYWRSSSVYSHERRTEAVGPCAGGFEELENLLKTTIKTERTVNGVKVTNTGDRLAFFVRIKAMKDGKFVPSVHYSDNYLNLLPGESASVIIEDLPPGATLSVEGWNAR